MQAAVSGDWISADDYLASERGGDVRHEYLGGTVHAMAGASEEHNLLSGNIYSALRAALHDKPCRVFMADMKVRLRVENIDVFYYPDVLVTCDSRDTERFFKQFPKLIVEVLSPETERIDRREKFLSYTRLDSLEEYVLVAQEKHEITVFRRSSGGQSEVFRQSSDEFRLESIGYNAKLTALYEGVIPVDR